MPRRPGLTLVGNAAWISMKVSIHNWPAGPQISLIGNSSNVVYWGKYGRIDNFNIFGFNFSKKTKQGAGAAGQN